MGGAGDSPAPVGDPPTGMGRTSRNQTHALIGRNCSVVPSGESPVLPKIGFFGQSFID